MDGFTNDRLEELLRQLIRHLSQGEAIEITWDEDPVPQDRFVLMLPRAQRQELARYLVEELWKDIPDPTEGSRAYAGAGGGPQGEGAPGSEPLSTLRSGKHALRHAPRLEYTSLRPGMPP